MERVCGSGFFGVSASYIANAFAPQPTQPGPASAGAQCNHVPLRLSSLKKPLLAQVALVPEQALVQLCQWVKAEHGMEVGPTTMGKTLVRFGLTLKKDATASEQTCADIAQAREVLLHGMPLTGFTDYLVFWYLI